MAEKDTQWKQKYYDSLDGIERQEKEWKALEDLFKQAISRLSLAAEGNSKSLDSDLNQLRAAIRKGQDNRTIRSILENVSREIIKLDKQAESGPGGDAGFLLKIIEQMRLAGKTEKKSRSLLKQLKSKNPPDQNELLKSFTELLSEVIKQAVLESKTNNGHNKTGGGFLKNLFSGGKEPLAGKEPSAGIEPSAGKEPLAENPEASQDSSTLQALVNETGEDQDDTLNQVQLTSVVATVQNVLETIIDGLDISEEVKEQLKNKVFKVKPSKEIHVLLDDLKDILDGSGIIEQHRNDSRANENPDGIAEHQDLLISLIEFLPLDESVKEQAEQLKDSFSHGVSTDQLPQALKSIADLISMMRTSVQQEQKEFELFLKNLTGRLKELDQYLQSNFQEHQQSYQSGVDLDIAVKDQVREIGDSVALINNLDEVESAVQTHLDQIVAHIDLHRTQEDERVARIEAQNNELSEQLKHLESESGQLRRQVIDSQNRALVDPLTQLPNRLAYDQRLKQEYARWKRYNSTLLIMVWDIDFFKQVNDTYGHQAGDKVLKVVASLLNKNLRETDFISRFGGEEFVSLMPETTLGGGYKVAEKIRESVEKLEFHYRGNNVKVTISCGISLFMENDTAERAFSRADKALYQAKEQGRNRCVIAKEPSA
ncbi:MAG: GGDEF domain-containing protein [Gammaproteobacteria bacterium]|nr:GGDEF domain-containing protein [Gammaproteobacteria bacterium]